MKKRGHISYMALAIALAVLVLSWTIAPGSALAANDTANGQAILKAKGLMTPAERMAAAQAIADRKAAAAPIGVLAAPLEAAPPIGVMMALPGATPHYFSHPNYANSQFPTVDPVTGLVTGGGIRKFVNGLPGLGAAGANDLGQYIPVAVPDITTYPGSDYYEIGLVQYREQMHSDIPATLLRGYVQISTTAVPGLGIPLTNAMLDGTSVAIPGFAGVDKPHYLGPAIVAVQNRPVRVKFYNLLPTGTAGDLFIPTDTTVMGAGPGPMMMNAVVDPLNPPCGDTPKPEGCYTENRATIHLHGGVTGWISDGTMHQWITPAGENPTLPQGVSVSPVPDMGDNGDPHDGIMTFYYANHQSARLLFYHDHSWGITRLNVYAGEAGPYPITDATEQALIAAGTIPGAADTIPLVVQDRTFVPDLTQLSLQDETWRVDKWGGVGSLWLPHVYSPAQNPDDPTGVNAYGRWMYGPYFWPPTRDIAYGPVANPYFDPNCDPLVSGWCEPSVMPGTPYNSMGMEAFHDTPIVNGTAYPTVTLEPKTYRFRVLNAANDRFWNLSWYVADASGKEVALNAAEVAAALLDPIVFPTPDELISPKGPNWVQIGTEGGFLPAPVVLPAQPTTWVTDPTVFNAGNVDKHSLLLGPAERADVIVDFSLFAGKTLILYNDGPAAFPARDPRYDYYTGSADLTATGGAPTVQPGYGPNTRTVMQVVIAGTPAPAFNVAAVETAFKSTKLGGGGVFETGQKPIVVGQAAYNSAYGTSFRASRPGNDGFVRIQDFNLTFDTLAGTPLSMPLQPKQIHDEMGAAFDPQDGRMAGLLGVETPFAQAGMQNMILMPLDHPPTEVIAVLPATLEATPISSADDGTQIWRITHNGVDTHPIHFHLYDVQIINRVGWDGIIRKPEANELGWKDTVRMSPLEDTIVALRPIIPYVPFELPNSIRLLNPSMPEGAYIANTTAAMAANKPGLFAFDPNAEPIDIINHYVNYGWEYVWHCHILSHEEMDMMRSQAVGVAPNAPTGLSAALVGSGTAAVVNLSWTDNSKNETAFSIQRATAIAGPWAPIAQVPSTLTGPTLGVITYTDPTGTTSPAYYYRVQAVNVVGDTWDYTDPALNNGAGFPTLTLVSAFSPVATWPVNLPAAPSNFAVVVTPEGSSARFRSTWTDNSNNETGFTMQSALDANFTQGVTTYTYAANRISGNQLRTPSTIVLYYRIRSFNANGTSAWANATPFPASLPVQPPAVPAAPSNFVITATVENATLDRIRGSWTDNSNNETGFTMQRASDPNFTTNVVTYAFVINRTTSNQLLPRGTNYYYRLRADGSVGSSAWVNATPFPITAP